MTKKAKLTSLTRMIEKGGKQEKVARIIIDAEIKGQKDELKQYTIERLGEIS